jgi:signal peptidase I
LAAILAMAAIGAWAVMTERISYVVTDGVSMNPVYYQGDLVFVVKADSYHVGQIAAYHGSSPGLKVLHRIIRGDAATGFTFKGDNNESIDPLKPTADKLIGHAVLHIPKGGIWLSPLLGPNGLGMLGFLLVSGAATTRTRREIPRGRRKKKVKAMARQGGSWATAVAVAKTVERLPPLLRVAAALVAALAGLGIALAVLGWMKPVTETQHASAESGQTMDYSYSATVPLSAAYDGTTVSSPEPIFRKLADRVDLHLRYRGHPGTVAVSAKLSDGAGWHSTMLIAPATRFIGSTYYATISLDLAAFDRRAQAAAKAIGSQMGTVTVGLTARVTAPGEDEFTAPLNFTLAPLALTLSGGNGSLTVTSGAADATTTVVAREIEVRGRPVLTAAAARSYSVLLLLAALVCAVVIGFVARRETPLRTRAEIERRHPQLLVHVEPMTSPPGKPVVNVDNFPALAKLAERYGQLILTWSRPDSEDFVVRDEGITYRYRIAADGVVLSDDTPTELLDIEAPVRHRRGVTVPATPDDPPGGIRYP